MKQIIEGEPMENILYDKDAFTAYYNKCKHDGIRDKNIAKELHISPYTLINYKKKYRIDMMEPHERALNNKNGITREMVKEAEKLGISSHLANRRVRTYNWTVEDAISIPPLPIDKRRDWKFKLKEHRSEGVTAKQSKMKGVKIND